MKFVNEQAKDLISHMIAPPDKRYRAQQVLQHRWMKETNKPNKGIFGANL